VSGQYDPRRHFSEISFAVSEVTQWNWVEPDDVINLVARWDDLHADAQANRKDMNYLTCVLHAAAARACRAIFLQEGGSV
jgi:hypothetical protein